MSPPSTIFSPHQPYEDHSVDHDLAARVRALENGLNSANISDARLETTLEHLNTAVEQLTSVVNSLNNIINQGKGALWFGRLIAGGIGGGLVLLLKRMFPGL